MGDMEKKETLLDPVAPARNIAPGSKTYVYLVLPSRDGWSWGAGTPLVQFVSMGSFLMCFCIMICAFIVIGGSGGGTSGPMPANNWTLSPLSQQLPCLNFDISG